jgi:hypothetical protein
MNSEFWILNFESSPSRLAAGDAQHFTPPATRFLRCNRSRGTQNSKFKIQNL